MVYLQSELPRTHFEARKADKMLPKAVALLDAVRHII
jgi:hypothetical protein